MMMGMMMIKIALNSSFVASDSTSCTTVPNACTIGSLSYSCFCCDSTMFTGRSPSGTKAGSPCVTPAYNAYFAVNLSDPFNTIEPCSYASISSTGVITAGVNCQQLGYMYRVTITSNDTNWNSFPDPCSYGRAVAAVTGGNQMPDPICMMMGGAVEYAALQKSYWYSTVDTFSLYDIRDSLRGGDSSNYWDCASRIAFSYGSNINSSPKRRFGFYSDGTANSYCNMVVPFWTLIINVNNGAVSSLTWDDDCSTCDSTHCIDGNCAVDIVNCDFYGGPTNCDIKVYVAWSGTDTDGYYFTSEQSTLSRFRQWSIAGAFSSATNFLPGALPSIDTTSGGSVVGSNPSSKA